MRNSLMHVIQGKLPAKDKTFGIVISRFNSLVTSDTLEQALERAGAKAGNKGWDAALSVTELLQVQSQLKKHQPSGDPKANV